MTKVNFNFGCGVWSVNVKDDKLKTVQLLVAVQDSLKLALPHRQREVEQFLIPCVMEILQAK